MDYVFSQTDAQIQAILNKIQPLVTTDSTAPLGFGYGVCSTARVSAVYDEASAFDDGCSGINVFAE